MLLFLLIHIFKHHFITDSILKAIIDGDVVFFDEEQWTNCFFWYYHLGKSCLSRQLTELKNSIICSQNVFFNKASKCNLLILFHFLFCLNFQVTFMNSKAIYQWFLGAGADFFVRICKYWLIYYPYYSSHCVMRTVTVFLKCY